MKESYPGQHREALIHLAGGSSWVSAEIRSPQISLELFPNTSLEARRVAGDSDRRDAVPPPLQVAVSVAGSPVRSGVVWPVDLDDGNAPVADPGAVLERKGRPLDPNQQKRPSRKVLPLMPGPASGACP
jgi:hypothetical protein